MPTLPDARRARTAIIATLLLATLGALGAALIPHRELWLDESHSAYLSRLPFAQLWAGVIGDVHPPLYFVALGGWVRMLGDSPVALRAFSLLAMVLAAAVVWRTAARDDGEPVGLVGLAWLALSPAILVYAVEIRMYALAMLTFGFTVYMVRRVRATQRMRDAIVAGIAGALAVYTHYAALFAVGGLFGAWLLADLRVPRTRRSALLACTVCALLFLPWTPTLLAQRARKQAQAALVAEARRDSTALLFGAPERAPAPRGRYLRQAAINAASVFGVFPARSVAMLALLAIPFAVLGALVLRRLMLGDRWLVLLLCSIGATLAGAVLLGLGGRRFVLFLGPLGALAVARAVSGLDGSPWRWPSRVATGAALVVLAVGSLRVLLQPRPTPVSDLVRALQAEAAPSDRLLFHAPYGQVLFDYYAERANLKLARTGFPETTTGWWSRQGFKGWGSPVPAISDLDRTVTELLMATERGGDVWLVLFETRFYDPLELVRQRLERQGTVVYQWASANSEWRAFRIRLHSMPGARVGQ